MFNFFHKIGIGILSAFTAFTGAFHSQPITPLPPVETAPPATVVQQAPANKSTPSTNVTQVLPAKQTPSQNNQKEQPALSDKVSTKVTNNSVDYDEERACLQQTNILIDGLNKEDKSMELQGGPSGEILSHENYFNSKEGKCYALVISTSDYKNSHGIGEELYNVYNNQRVASFSPSTLFCQINGTLGCNYDNFKNYVNEKFSYTISW